MSALFGDGRLAWYSAPLLGLLVVFTAKASYQRWIQKRQLDALPVAQVRDQDWKEALFAASAKASPCVSANETYTANSLMRQWPDTPFVINTGERPRVVLPNSTMDQVRRLPEHELSLRKDLYEKMFGRWTEVGTAHETGINAIRKDLTNNIVDLLPEMQDETRFAVDTGIGSCPEWRRVPLFQHLLQVSAWTNGRFFVGPLCRDQEWVKLSLGYAVDIIASVRILQSYPSYARQFVAPFLPELRKLKKYKKRAAVMLQPYVEMAVSARQPDDKTPKQVDDNKRADEGLHLLSWMLNHVNTNKRVDTEYLAREQLFIGSGSIHSSALALSNVIFDLAAKPKYISDLRDEIEATMAQEPGGTLRKQCLPKMRKLDSLLLESQRMNPVSLTSIHRRVTARDGLRLSTGHIIPYDTSVAYLHPYAPFSSPPPELASFPLAQTQPPLTEFYPFRFSEQRGVVGHEGMHQFTQTGRENINFGHGPASCPGRWFASTLLKCVMIELILKYDFALGPNGEGEESPGFERPPTKVMPGSLQVMPDMSAAVFFRERNPRT